MDYITIKDIAKKLNVSVATISRAFNDKYGIKKETRDLVLKTAEEMGYRPNPMARKLISKRSYNIGIVIPEFINSYFPEVIIGAQEVLFEKGYQVLITQSNESYETEIKNVKNLVDSMVDGLIISLSSETKNVDYYKKLVDQGMPMVFFNRFPENFSTTRILFNDYKWSFFATEHLISQGCKDIVHLKGANTLTLSHERARGFADALKKHKMPPKENQYYETGFTIEDGIKTAEKMIKENRIPDGIFAVNDPSAIGAMKAFKEHGYKIPEDIAIVGFTESKMASIVEPQLSSVSQPTVAIGKHTAELLLNQIENPETLSEPKTILLNGELKIRKSSLKK